MKKKLSIKPRQMTAMILVFVLLLQLSSNSMQCLIGHGISRFRLLLAKFIHPAGAGLGVALDPFCDRKNMRFLDSGFFPSVQKK